MSDPIHIEHQFADAHLSVVAKDMSFLTVPSYAKHRLPSFMQHATRQGMDGASPFVAAGLIPNALRGDTCSPGIILLSWTPGRTCAWAVMFLLFLSSVYHKMLLAFLWHPVSPWRSLFKRTERISSMKRLKISETTRIRFRQRPSKGTFCHGLHDSWALHPSRDTVLTHIAACYQPALLVIRSSVCLLPRFGNQQMLHLARTWRCQPCWLRTSFMTAHWSALSFFLSFFLFFSLSLSLSLLLLSLWILNNWIRLSSCVNLLCRFMQYYCCPAQHGVAENAVATLGQQGFLGQCMPGCSLHEVLD